MKALGMKFLFLTLIFASEILAKRSEPESSDKPGIPRIGGENLEWIRQQLGYFKDMVSDGLSMSELQFLRTYLLGFSPEEAARLEDEIETLLQDSDGDEFSFGNFTFALEDDSAEGESPQELENPEANKQEKRKLKLLEKVVDRYWKKTNDNIESFVKIPDTLIISKTIVQQQRSLVPQTVLATHKVTLVSTLTTTIGVPKSRFLTEVATEFEEPSVVTETLFLTSTSYVTKKTSYPTTQWTTKSLFVHETQIDVDGSYGALTQTTPAYVTFSSPSYFTTIVTSTATLLSSSQMPLTDTKYREIPVTVTQTKNRVVEQIITETEFKKIMITKTSTILETSTTTAVCKKGFLKRLKNPFA